MQNFYELLENIKVRPAMYLGQKGISFLRTYLDGYHYALWAHHIAQKESPPFGLMHTWIAHKLGWGPTSAGWNTILLEENQGNEEKALDHFFELLPQFKKIMPVWISEAMINRANIDFYRAVNERLPGAETNKIFPVEKHPDKMYLVEFSDRAGWYNYWLKDGKLLSVDWGFGDRSEAFQKVADQFGKDVALKQVPHSWLQQTFEQLIHMD